MINQFIDAAAVGDVDAVRAMLARDPSLARASDGSQFTALHAIVGQDDVRMAELLIAAGAEVSARNDVGMTPLHIAQYASVVDVLLRHGADVNARANARVDAASRSGAGELRHGCAGGDGSPPGRGSRPEPERRRRQDPIRPGGGAERGRETRSAPFARGDSVTRRIAGSRTAGFVRWRPSDHGTSMPPAHQ